MNILLLGSGGREHALAWKIAQSPRLTRLYMAPGNPGMASLGECVNLKVSDFAAIGQFALDHDIRLLVVGPENPLVDGIADYFKTTPGLSQVGVIGPPRPEHGSKAARTSPRPSCNATPYPRRATRPSTAPN